MKRTLRKLSTLLLALPFVACVQQPTLNQPAKCSETVGLNTLAIIEEGETNLPLTDFILHTEKIDSVTSSTPLLTISLNEDKSIAQLQASAGLPMFVNLRVWMQNTYCDIPIRKSDKIDYEFTYDPQGSQIGRIQIAGQMNNWVPSMTPDLTLNDKGIYSVTMHLSPGTYLYQLMIDGDQNHDRTNPNKVDNGFGKYNSILQVKGQDALFPHLFTKTHSATSIDLEGFNQIDQLFVYWDNYRLPQEWIHTNGKNIRISIPAEAKTIDRSFIRAWASNEYGISNDILIPLHKGRVLDNTESITRHDKHANMIYFMLVDRFKNGSKENDHPMHRKDVNPKVDYFGGDLAGLNQTINSDYFNQLGLNTLWCSPLNQNPWTPYGYYAPQKTKFAGYHGYWPISSSKVDERFGSNQELKDLVEDAHTKGINVLMDFVANHVHENHPLFQAHPEYATQLNLPDGRKNIALWDEQRLTTWFDDFMPSLDYSNPKVVQLMTDSAMFWVKEFKLDGFRHDACKHVNNSYWRSLTRAIKEYDPSGNIYQIGESYGSPELMQSYVNSGMLDGQFDFNVFDEASSAFNGVSGGTMKRLSNILTSSLKIYGNHNLMGYVSGNHDKPRFMALASGDLKLGEDSQAAGWERHIGITDSTAYDKLALFHAFNFTIPGVPVIYYGDEIGMTGGNDPDCRRMMRFENLNPREQALKEKVSTLAHFRRNHLALIYGDFINLQVTEQTWVYARKYFDQEAIIFINNSDQQKEYKVELPIELNGLNLTPLFGHHYNMYQNTLQITLPAYSCEILH